MRFEQEEQAIIEAYERGEITREEHDLELREMQRDYQAAAEEAAEDAYQDELQGW